MTRPITTIVDSLIDAYAELVPVLAPYLGKSYDDLPADARHLRLVSTQLTGAITDLMAHEKLGVH